MDWEGWKNKTRWEILESFWHDLVCKRKILEQKLKKGEQ